MTIFVNWAVGFDTERRRSDEYYYDPYSGYYCKYKEHQFDKMLARQTWLIGPLSDKQTNRRQDDDNLSDKILQYTDSLGNIIDSFGNAIDVRPTISRMGKGIYAYLVVSNPNAVLRSHKRRWHNHECSG